MSNKTQAPQRSNSRSSSKGVRLERAVQNPLVIVSFRGRPFNEDGGWTPRTYEDAIRSGYDWYTDSGPSA